MWFANYRQKLQLLLIVFFVFVAFGAADDAWMPWVRAPDAPSLSPACAIFLRRVGSLTQGLLVHGAQATLVVFLSMILLTDLLFLDAAQFQYNPDYKVISNARRVGSGGRWSAASHSLSCASSCAELGAVCGSKVLAAGAARFLERVLRAFCCHGSRDNNKPPRATVR